MRLPQEKEIQKICKKLVNVGWNHSIQRKEEILYYR